MHLAVERLEFLKIIILTNPALTCPEAAGGSEGFSKKACVSWGYYFRLKFREGDCFAQLVFLEKQALGKTWTKPAGCGMESCWPGEQRVEGVGGPGPVAPVPGSKEGGCLKKSVG